MLFLRSPFPSLPFPSLSSSLNSSSLSAALFSALLCPLLPSPFSSLRSSLFPSPPLNPSPPLSSPLCCSFLCSHLSSAPPLFNPLLSLLSSPLSSLCSSFLRTPLVSVPFPSLPGFATVALPKVIARWWWDDGRISFHTCLFQEQMIHYFGTLNSLIMLTMAMDRYLAICHPLRYPMLMTNQIMSGLTVFSWMSATISPAIGTIDFTRKVAFCGPNRILHAYCDALSLTKLSCSDMAAIQGSSIGLAYFVLLVPFSFIVFSYINIIVTVMRMANAQGRMKTFSTCATQGCIILIYYMPRFIVYATPYIPNLIMTPDLRIGLTIFYSLFPPVANPFIYSFRTKEIRAILGRWRQGWRNSQTEPSIPKTVA
ncbi:unnamed protein product, partial [Oncorhynchus mykiss]